MRNELDDTGNFEFELTFPDGSQAKRTITYRPDLSPSEWSSRDLHGLMLGLANVVAGAPVEPGEQLLGRVWSTEQGGVVQVAARGVTATLVFPVPLNPLASDEWNARHPMRVWHAPPRTGGT